MIISESNQDPNLKGALSAKPLITTIIPTYRRPKQLKQAILSVLHQTYHRFQVCVYDNASGDDTALIVAEISKHDPRVKYYCHKENIGAINNFKFGLERVATPFFSFLSDDDLILREFYETALDGFKSHPDAIFSVTDVLYIGMQGKISKTPLETWNPGVYRPPEGVLAMLEYGHSAWTGILFKREITEVVGFLDLETGAFSDLDFALRAATRCPFVVSKRPCAVFCESIDQSRAPYPFALKWPGILKMIKNITEDENLPLHVRAYAENVILRKFEAELFGLGLAYLSRENPADARRVASLLRNQFGGWIRYVALSAIINACQYVPFARLGFDALISCRRYVRTKCVQFAQKRYKSVSNLIFYDVDDKIIKPVSK